MRPGMEVTLEHIRELAGSSAGLGVALLVLLGLAMRLRETPAPRLYIWAMIGFFLIDGLDMLDDIALEVPYPVLPLPLWLIGWELVLYPGYMICLWLFVRGLTSADPRLRPGDILHLLPLLVTLIVLLPLLTMSGDAKNQDWDFDNPENLRMILAGIGYDLALFIWIGSLVVYGTLCVRRLTLHKKNIRRVFSDLEGKALLWLDMLVATILILAGIVLLDEILALMGLPIIRNGMADLVFDLGMSISMGIFALRAVPPLPAWSQEIIAAENEARKAADPASIAEPDPAPSPKTAPPKQSAKTAKRYARSGLTEEDLTRLAERLEARMSRDKLWRDSTLNLQSLAEAAAMAPIHLSEVLNTRIGASFYDYVNRLRVEEACSLLTSTDMTVLDISEAVGFNAKSTFNASFKRLTGKTPSAWRSAGGEGQPG